MPAFFFGPSARPLYGVLEAPASRAPGARARTRPTGVLLLYPGVHEYLRAHWAFRSLAAGLAARGFPVLRFDYRGTGDSWGDPDATTFEGCVDDARIAADELREAAGVAEVLLLGMRLGAAVALHAAAELPFVRRVLLWNPVVRGRDYVAELEHMDAAMRLRLLHPLRRPPDELAGYPFPPAVRRSLESVDLRHSVAGPVRRMEIFAESISPERCARCELRGAVRAAPLPPLGSLSTECTLCEALGRAGHAVSPHAIPHSSGPSAFPDAALLAQGAVSTLVAETDESGP